MGIFCVSRIFGVTHTYVRTNKTVSPKNPRVTHSVCSDFVDNSFRKVCRIFRAFRRKVSTMSKRNIRGGYQQMFAQGTRYPCSRNYTKHQIKRKNGTNIPKMRVFYEHFCRNDCSNIIFYNPKFAPAFERIFRE